MDPTLASRRPRFALATQGVMALWLVVNGIAHEIGVLVGDARGTLSHPEELGALLAVGAGLLLAGVIATWAIVPLSRGRTRAALASVGVVAIVVVAIATRYGWMFLGGTSVIAIVNAVVLAAGSRSARASEPARAFPRAPITRPEPTR